MAAIAECLKRYEILAAFQNGELTFGVPYSPYSIGSHSECLALIEGKLVRISPRKLGKFLKQT